MTLEAMEAMEGGGASPIGTRSDKGVPQGGVISPLLANIYLHWFDMVFQKGDGPAHWARARLVRYADDFVVLARYIDQRITGWIEAKIEGWIGLEINRDKTRVLNLRRVGESLDFLGYTFRHDRDRYGRGHRYLNVTSSKKALAREREKLREMTGARMCFKPIPTLIGEINEHLRGWSNYFAWGYPRKAFREINPAKSGAASPPLEAKPTPVAPPGRDNVLRPVCPNGADLPVRPCW